jgi:hypothetical protein
MGKDSFILYDNYDEQLAALTDQQVAILFRAIYDYRHNRKLPEMDGAVKMAFSFIRAQIDRDQERYEDICEKRRAAGALGGAPKGNQNAGKQAKQANATKCKQNKQMQAKQADNDNDDDNDIKEKEDNKLSKKKGFAPPTLEDVQAYAAQRGREDLAAAFYDYFTAGDWKDSNGAPVKNWKQKFITWETHNVRKDPPQQNNTYRKTVLFWQGD